MFGSTRLAKMCILKYEKTGDPSQLFPLIELIRLTPEYQTHESFEFLFKIYIETGDTRAIEVCQLIHPHITLPPTPPRIRYNPPTVPTTPRQYDFWGNLISV